MENMTAERLQQEIDGLTGWRYILISGRIEKGSKFPDFWKIDHSLNGFYAISGPDFLTFGEKLEVRKKGDGFFEIQITNKVPDDRHDRYDIVGYVYMKDVYNITVDTPEASA